MIALLGALTVAAAAEPKPASADDAANIGIAMLAPEQQRIEVQQVLGYCAMHLSDMQPALDKARIAWVDRQATVLYVSALYRSSARRKSLDTEEPQATRDALKKLLDVDIPRVIAQGVETALRPLQDAERLHSLRPACERYLESVNARRLDLANEAPALVKFMEESAPSTLEAAIGPP